ncbi:MAG TPA: serine/threonine-protein kinase [Kofleriaceae bacterium]|nr:serine/threonine-protein kinase [Kofleriaceae bacterium]
MRPSSRTTDPQDAFDWLGRGAAVGPWVIERELGKGGMSTVYAVTHAIDERRAALKLARLDPTDGPITAACFLLEARCAIAVSHPGAVRVIEAGAIADRPYLVMERLAGRTLGEVVDEGPVPHADAIAILLELCEVLGAAHAEGIVHRDVKLDNVFVLGAPAPRRTKLIDWGVARIRGEEDPWAGMMAGTPQYVAPEQARGEEVGPATDVYALGVLTYRLFLGRLPFDSDSPTRLMRMHCKARPPRAHTHASIPCAIDDVMRSMLAKRAAERPSLSEVSRALGDAAARLPR